MHLKYFNIIIFTLICFTFSCKYYRQKEEKNIVLPENELISANKYLVNQDQESIKKYIERHNWQMKSLETGMWYMIYKKGKGKKIHEGSKVSYEYSIELLDGTQCYNSKTEGMKTIVCGRGNIESGLEDGMLLLTNGDQAKFILPPHLAHGLIGDANRIPARSIIVYDVKIVSVEN